MEEKIEKMQNEIKEIKKEMEKIDNGVSSLITWLIIIWIIFIIIMSIIISNNKSKFNEQLGTDISAVYDRLENLNFRVDALERWW